MAAGVSYFDMAENDYEFFRFDHEHGRVGNAMCYASQNICERYLKHVIDMGCKDIDTTHILKTHNLKSIKQFIVRNIPDFQCNWKEILQADGYYFSTRYPGDEAYFVDADDVEECWEAVEETRRAVMEYCAGQKEENNGISDGDSVIESLKVFTEQ